MVEQNEDRYEEVDCFKTSCQVRHRLITRDREYSELQNKFNENVKYIEQIKARLQDSVKTAESNELMGSQLKEGKKQIESYELERNKLVSENIELRENFNTAQIRKDRLEEERKILLEEVAQMKTMAREKQKEIIEIKTAYDFDKEIIALKKEVKELEKHEIITQNQVKKLEMYKDNVKHEIEKEQIDLVNARDEYRKLYRDFMRLKEQRDGMKTEILKFKKFMFKRKEDIRDKINFDIEKAANEHEQEVLANPFRKEYWKWGLSTGKKINPKEA